jgi:hypothetical protein
MEHADIGAAIEMIKWFLALLCSVTSAFCGIMLWVGKKIDTVKCSINSLNDTVVTGTELTSLELHTCLRGTS